MSLETVVWQKDHLTILNHQQLPNKISFENLFNIEQVWQSINFLKVAGDEDICLVAGYGLALWAHSKHSNQLPLFLDEFEQQSLYLATSMNSLSFHQFLKRLVASVQKATNVKEAKEIALSEVYLQQKNWDLMWENLGLHTVQLFKNEQNILFINATNRSPNPVLSIVHQAKQKGISLHPYFLGEHDENLTLIKVKLKNLQLTTSWIKQNHLHSNIISAVLLCFNALDHDLQPLFPEGSYDLAKLAYENEIPIYVIAPTAPSRYYKDSVYMHEYVPFDYIDGFITDAGLGDYNHFISHYKEIQQGLILY
ncbi:hypothetical protein [Alkalihalobacillus trypoxylicola]|uniref:Uncharacterized protein n=1 Tax=Alkalihalobacillus trypoxylicola TaxID=519424 RepID=A0A162EAE6_9BACI|nr:hypothetical protein [Alkalihalobacillus trypoxylicola]KYG32151.1 hypothetical protein AZF04_05120 [Alkalihalobacillus trypoxylicola]